MVWKCAAMVCSLGPALLKDCRELMLFARGRQGAVCAGTMQEEEGRGAAPNSTTRYARKAVATELHAIVQQWQGQTKGLFIVCTALSDFNGIIHQPIYKPMLIINASAPIACQFIFERFRLADADMPIPVNILKQRIDTFYCSFILCLSVEVVFPCRVRPDFTHGVDPHPQAVVVPAHCRSQAAPSPRADAAYLPRRRKGL